MQTKPRNKEKIDRFKGYAKYSAMGFQMVIIIGGGVWGGYLLDKWVAWKFPLFIVICSILAVAMAIYYAIKDI